jgi:ABC-type amino acid transport substrate-binding protein
MGKECELVIQDWEGMIPGLLAKKYDAIIASMSITEERKAKVNFTKKYYASTANFIGKKGTTLNITHDMANNKKVLSGKKIGVQQSAVSDNFISDNFNDVVDLKRYGKQEEANLDLISGRLDLVFADSVPMLEFLKTPNGSSFENIGVLFDDVKWFGEGIGIPVRKEDNKLLEELNQAIDTIINNGKYQEIQAKYFDFDIYGQ